MNWLNIETTTLDSEAFVGSEPVARATWLCLLRYCCGQENGGVIVGCAVWSDRKWQQLCRVTLPEVQSPSALWTWEADDLHLWAYPSEKQAEVQAKREAGAKGGKSSTQAKVEAARFNGAKHNPSTTQAEPKQNPSCNPTERKGKERKGIGKEEYIAPHGAPLVLTGEPEAPQKPKRERDAVLDALATVGGGKPEEVTQWGTAIAARAAIVAVTPQLDAVEVRRRATNYRTHFDGAALTPTALAKHWAVCDAAKSDVRGRTGIDQISQERAASGGQFDWEKGKNF